MHRQLTRTSPWAPKRLALGWHCKGPDVPAPTQGPHAAYGRIARSRGVSLTWGGFGICATTGLLRQRRCEL